MMHLALVYADGHRRGLWPLVLLWRAGMHSQSDHRVCLIMGAPTAGIYLPIAKEVGA